MTLSQRPFSQRGPDARFGVCSTLYFLVVTPCPPSLSHLPAPSCCALSKKLWSPAVWLWALGLGSLLLMPSQTPSFCRW
jgi:hypothetical protein